MGALSPGAQLVPPPGQTAGIDPRTGRVRFGASIADIVARRDEKGGGLPSFRAGGLRGVLQEATESTIRGAVSPDGVIAVDVGAFAGAAAPRFARGGPRAGNGASREFRENRARPRADTPPGSGTVDSRLRDAGRRNRFRSAQLANPYDSLIAPREMRAIGASPEPAMRGRPGRPALASAAGRTAMLGPTLRRKRRRFVRWTRPGRSADREPLGDARATASRGTPAAQRGRRRAWRGTPRAPPPPRRHATGWPPPGRARARRGGSSGGR